MRDLNFFYACREPFLGFNVERCLCKLFITYLFQPVVFLMKKVNKLLKQGQKET